jgi:hypothetical protein
MIAKQKCDDQIWTTGREILQEKPVQTCVEKGKPKTQQQNKTA